MLLAELLATLLRAELDETAIDERDELARLLEDEPTEERALDVAPTTP